MVTPKSHNQGKHHHLTIKWRARQSEVTENGHPPSMHTSIPRGKPRRAGETGNRALKANKACVPCRARKVKCDAPAVGFPCSNCMSRQCATNCILAVRKGRTRTVIRASPVSSEAADVLTAPESTQGDSLNQPDQPNPSKSSKQSFTSSSIGCQSPCQTEPDLLYLNILNDAVKETTEPSLHRSTSTTPYRTRLEEDLTSRNYQWARFPQLDDIDNEYLAKKGVFDLPPPTHLDALIRTYFNHVYPFGSVIDRVDFIRGYQSGDCSLFILRVILTLASLHAPADVLSVCGFASRSAAQESFFSKAKLLHDFVAEEDPLLMLQGSILLCTVILDHPTDRDFGYWFHSAIRLATKIDLRNVCIREDKPPGLLKLYRRIWWALYSLDVFHVFINPRRSRLLEETPAIKLRTEDDWGDQDITGDSSGLLSVVTPQQKASIVVHCELFRIFGELLPMVTGKPQQDPRQMMQPLDAWRKSLPLKMHVDGNTGTDVYYLNIQAMSYRFECILCRLLRRGWQQPQHADWSEWAKQRLRSAILELGTITMRVLAGGTLQEFPTPFMTTITALLALHIESALDPAETDLVHSMSRISISQTMLVLTQGKEIPVLKRALPIFEEIILKKKLYVVSPNILGQTPAHLQLQGNSITADANTSLHTHIGVTSSQLEQSEIDLSFDADFLGLDFLDEWRVGELELSDRY